MAHGLSSEFISMYPQALEAVTDLKQAAEWGQLDDLTRTQMVAKTVQACGGLATDSMLRGGYSRR